MSLGQFFLGLVAICVATIVYRWQKSVDRETSVLAERRDLYAKYLASSKELYLSQPFLGVEYSIQKLESFYNLSPPEIQNYCLRDQILLIAPNNVVEALDQYDKSFRKWKIAFPRHDTESRCSEEVRLEFRERDETLRHGYNKLIQAFRTDISNHSGFNWKFFIQKGFIERASRSQ